MQRKTKQERRQKQLEPNLRWVADVLEHLDPHGWADGVVDADTPRAVVPYCVYLTGESGVEGSLGPSIGHVVVLADVGVDDEVIVVVVAVEVAEAGGKVEVSGLVAAAEGAVDGDGGAAGVLERALHLGPSEVVEHAAEDHALAALLRVHAPRPVAYVQLEHVAMEAASEEHVPLLAAQRP
ncbi:hypothetical protein GUJ93_ZPchr0008g13514 [Zizania palustris]|uniref:Uncharacterized protein n=1 Tax=Zizania palustris TaxID=103762 RepID=A0A8J5RJ10_ZIZPA|nr:hypothetical protein GUJ93_ZPchr0008g13514 [Zizania palustris]